MSIFAISDLHLACDDTKRMDVFGEKWAGHFEKIKNDWMQNVGEDDVVLLPGDLSWAINMDEAKSHIDAICSLPGSKIITRGNHDYWWGSLTKVRERLFNNTYAVQNDSKVIGDYVFCGTRGWMLETDRLFSPEKDKAILDREILRLKLSLDSAVKHTEDGKTLVLMMHFPPLYPQLNATCFSETIEQYKVKKVVFGHIHGETQDAFEMFSKNGIDYHLVSCDYLDFRLKKII